MPPQFLCSPRTLTLVLTAATVAFAANYCVHLHTDYRYLDFHAVDLGGRDNRDRMGDFDFCVPESRTLLRHSAVPQLSDSQYWELFIRTQYFHRIGAAVLALDHGHYRLQCINGSYLLYERGEVTRLPNWTEVAHGGASHAYTDTHQPSESLLFGFQCLRMVLGPHRSQLQGVCLRRFCCLWDLGLTGNWRGREYLEGWHHPVAPSHPPAWDHTGPMRCGGIASSVSLLNSTDPLHPIGTAPRRLGLNQSGIEPDLLSSWEQNSFIQLLSKVAKETTTRDCWICAHAPTHMRQGLPLVPVAVTLEQFRSGDVASWNLTALNLTHQYLYLTGPTRGPLCRRFTGQGPNVGVSVCDINLELRETGQVIITSPRGTQTASDLSAAWTTVVGPVGKPNPALLQSFASGRMESYLAGLWWICAHRGYRWVSPHMSGSCYIGYIVPGIRVTHDLPTGRQRNKREEQALSDLSDVAANGETWGRALFPAYGAGSNHVDILKLTDILLKFMRETEQVTDALTTELSQVRQLSIQNRIATDFLLSSEGGTCALIGSECCTYVTDQTLNITGHLNNIHRLAGTLRDIQHEGLSGLDLWGWLPDLGWAKQLLKGLVVIVLVVTVCIVTFCCVAHCWGPCCSLFRCPSRKAPNAIFPLRAYSRTAIPFPEYVQMRHLGEGEYQITEL